MEGPEVSFTTGVSGPSNHPESTPLNMSSFLLKDTKGEGLEDFLECQVDGEEYAPLLDKDGKVTATMTVRCKPEGLDDVAKMKEIAQGTTWSGPAS